MDANVKNLLYSRPELYEQVYPEPNEETPNMCHHMFDRFFHGTPKSILDIGCGTGRDLGVLSRSCPDCWGVDYLPAMIALARSKWPDLHLSVGDMRSVRLGRTFDVILCMGSALMYALTNEEVDAALGTFAAHAHTGSLLLLDINNGAGYLDGGCFSPSKEFSVAVPGFTAHAVATHSFDRRKQLLIRKRVWRIEGQPPVEDFCRYRLLFPAELEDRCQKHRFSVVGMFDNMELKKTDLSGPRLYVASVFRG